MDAVYYASSTLMTLLVIGLLALTIVFLIKPHLLNNRKVIKKPLSRFKILLVGILAVAVTMIGFGPVLAATEPDSEKAARTAQETTKSPTDPIKETSTPVVKEETKIEAVAFDSVEQESSSLAKGEKKITTEGENGEKTIYYQVTYVDGKETARTTTKEEVTKEPITQVTSVGTYVAPAPASGKSESSSKSSCNPNYSGCVPNVSYDLNCPDIGYKVKVLGYDQYHLDADHDGWGCDSY